MPWLRTVAREMYGLFVDDGSFALAVLLWLAVAWLGLPQVAAGGQGVLLAGGLVVILGRVRCGLPAGGVRDLPAGDWSPATRRLVPWRAGKLATR